MICNLQKTKTMFIKTDEISLSVTFYREELMVG